MQLRQTAHKPQVVGYGEAPFDTGAVKDGCIEKPELIAQAVNELFRHHLVGDITTRRVAVSLPMAKAFTRFIDVPRLSDKELAEAVKNEAEQYIPAALDNLYLDYTRITSTPALSTVFIVATQRRIVDSYLTLSHLLGLEVVMIQTSGDASAHFFTRDRQSDVPSLLVDFGSYSADITLYDKGPIISGTAACGSDLLTLAIAKELGVTEKEGNLIKAKYGLGLSKKQAQIEKALRPNMGLLIMEIKRTIRYYEEHAHNQQKVSQIVISGGGANMPGLAEYLTSNLRIAVRSFDPTSYIDFGHLQPFNLTDRMSYVTATGLADIKSEEIFS